MSSKTGERVRTRVRDLPSFIPHVPAFEGEDTLDAAKEGEAFLTRLSTAVSEKDWEAFGELFCADGCFWRDCLTLTFDKRTLQGRKSIAEAWKLLSSARNPVIHTTKQEYALHIGAAFSRHSPTSASLEVPFCFSTDSPRSNCVGLAKLVPQDGTWKIWVLATAIMSLQDHPFEELPRTSPSLVSDAQRGKSRAQGLPDVDGVFDAVVIGGSTNGVSNTIAMDALGLNVIALDSHQQAGGNWSQPGRAYVTLHHLPVLMTLPQYSIPHYFSPDMTGPKITRYISGAVEALNLPVFCGINVVSNTYDEKTKLWDVQIEDVNTKKQATLKAKNIVICTGAMAGNHNRSYPSLADRELFKGPVLHSAEYKDAQPFQEKSVLVVGASNSAHDVARNLVEGGAKDVSILQRGTTAFFHWDIIGPVIDGSFASGLPLDTCDFLDFLTVPVGVARDIGREAVTAMDEAQSDFYEALEAKGYSIERGRDFVSELYETKNGSILMDRQNALSLVLHDYIKVARGEARRYTDGGLVVFDKEKSEEKVIRADAIVLATGFKTVDLPAQWAEGGFIKSNSISTLENPCPWDLDEEGEYIGHFTVSGREFSTSLTMEPVFTRICARSQPLQCHDQCLLEPSNRKCPHSPKRSERFAEMICFSRGGSRFRYSRMSKVNSLRDCLVLGTESAALVEPYGA